MKVFLCPVSESSLYAALTFRDLAERHEQVFREQGGLPQAIAYLVAGAPVLVHVQWEEFFFDKSIDEDDARATLAEVKSQLCQIKEFGGRIVWTVHNETPHLITHTSAFLDLRRQLAEIADVILVHNQAAVDLLRVQVDLDPARATMLPHPSYAGMYEQEGVAERKIMATRKPATGRFVLGFGAMRAQKGFDLMLEALGGDFTAAHDMRIRISGRGPEGKRLQQRFATRDDIDWDLRYLPNAEVPGLFRTAACIVLPYERVLTSGVVMLALTLGGIVVAPDAPTFREVLPEAMQRFLYRPGNAEDLRRAVTEILALDLEEARACRLAGLAVAQQLHPSLISARLGEIYDDLAGQVVPPPSPYAEAIDRMDRIEPRAKEREPIIGDWPIAEFVVRNWGDKLNPVIMALLSDRPVLRNGQGLRNSDADVYKVIGSGIAAPGEKRVVWGMGFIDSDNPIPSPRRICSVRGPLTFAKFLAAGHPCPEIFGDPALLLPIFYRPDIPVEFDLGIIQHFRDANVEPLPSIPEGMRVKLIDIEGSITGVIDDILSCREIISSSLHGLIAAHSYGVPATWIKFGNRPLGDDFKFRDYWASVGWRHAQPLWVSDADSCADLVGEKLQVKPIFSVPALIEACPFIDDERKAALLRHASKVFPTMPVVSFLAKADPLRARGPGSDSAARPPGLAGRPPLSVIIGIRNWGLDRLELALRSIREGEAGDSFEIVLSDFGSDNAAEVAALGQRFGCRYVYSEASSWSRSQAINAAARVATAPYLVTSDADIIFAPATLITLLGYLEAVPDAIHALQYSDLPEQFSVAGIAARGHFAWDEFTQNSLTRPRWGMGCVACSLSTFQTIRGYDERMTVWGAEDRDIVVRAQRNGFSVNWVDHPYVQLYHIWHKPFLAGGQEATEVHMHNKRLLQDPSLERNFRPGAFFHGQDPLVSVVIASRNRAGLLTESLMTVIAQTMVDFEIVVIDDCSTDETPSAVGGLQDSRIRYHRLAEQKGLPAARNIGNKLARGKYIAIHDDDDLMLPDRLECQLAALQTGDVGTYGGWVDFDAELNGGSTFCNPGRAPFGVAELMFASKLQLHPTFLLRRDICLRHPYEESFRGGSDYHLVSRLAMAGYSLRHCGRYVILRRLHGQNMTRLNADTQSVASRATRAAIFGFLSPAQEQAMKAIGAATELYPIEQPALAEQIAQLIGDSFCYSTDRLDYSSEAFEALRDAGIAFGVEVRPGAKAMTPAGLVLDRRDHARYDAIVPLESRVASIVRRKQTVRVKSFNTPLTDRFLTDNLLKGSRFSMGAIDLDFFGNARHRPFAFSFASADWHGFDNQRLLLDKDDRPMLVFEPDGSWRLLMDLAEENEIDLRAVAASHQGRSLGVHEFVEESLI